VVPILEALTEHGEHDVKEGGHAAPDMDDRRQDALIICDKVLIAGNTQAVAHSLSRASAPGATPGAGLDAERRTCA
jgi:hypothetical protein